ncbi:hypothetical protein [Methylobacterium sp. 17Sr1-1]|uniref:hypothetical protein n=1 Tax=Methylobacterium sp. 17Sr1-1 TaxID=2202826 RepID=UPI000D6F82F8|nr:hypothetical protein [Methylobacterium sp. 17Sr1-1]AWN51330.1 hypothetical protein DK412_06170 [Methylobacterium sp. 17Sr1-1]
MRLLLATALLALAAGTAAAQTETPAPLGSTPTGITAPDAAPAPPATGRRQPRRVEEAASARSAKPAAAKADSADSLRKAQAATAARDKAWDARMKRTLGSICHGC